MKKLLLLALAAALASCAGEYGTATPAYYVNALPSNPDARWGVLFEFPNPPAEPGALNDK